MSDYRVKITIRNDRILSKIEELGFPSVLKFCQHTGMQYGHTNDIISGKITPFYEVKGSGVCGEIRKNVKRLLETLDMTIEEAFTEQQLKEIYNLLSKLGAIDEYLWKHKVVFSENFIENIKEAYRRRNNKCRHKLDLCRHLSIKLPQKKNISQQKSTKKRKEKESENTK